MAYLNTQICGLFFVFSLVPDLLFDCLRVLEYAEIQTVLQSLGNYSQSSSNYELH